MSSSHHFVRTSSLIGIGAVLLFSFVYSQNMTHGTPVQESDKKKSEPQDGGSPNKIDPTEHVLGKFMRQKLRASNLILEGLCTDDLKMVADGAKTLKRMSGEEHWRVSNDILYKRYSGEFVHAVEELQKESEDNNMDGTSMAWVNVTMKCLKCHEWVRNAVLADGE